VVKKNGNRKTEYGSKNVSKCSLALYRDMKFNRDKTSYVECCAMKEKSGIGWLLAGVWKLRRIRKK
jgi:hypothetical protein